MEAALGAILISQEEIQRRVGELGRQISHDYAGKTITMVAILKGSFVFLADLIRRIDPEIPVELDFMAVSSYGDSTTSSGVVQIDKDIGIPLEGKDVLIVEDIVDSGLTLLKVCNVLTGRRTRSLKVASLLEKPGNSKHGGQVDYLGFAIPNKFVVGYGLDFAQRFRNLPDIRVLNEV
jgi:hypoxanthine phosphoribosyltransferase